MMLRLMILTLLLAPAAVASAAPDARAPTGKWVVNFDDAQCVATRAYGSAEKPLHFILKAPPLGEVMQIAVMRDAGRTDPAQVQAEVGIDERQPLRTNMLTFSPKNQKLRVYLLNLRAADFLPVREANSLTIRSGGLNETFALTQMGPLLKVMDQCVTDLRQLWNVVDPAGEQSPLEKRASGNLISAFKADDYPADAVINNQSGSVRFSVLIDESGRVADCTIIETSGVASLDAQSCAIVKERARYQPAVGKDGKAAKDAVVARVTWRLPD